MSGEYDRNRSKKEKQIFDALIALMQTRNVWEITVSELTKQASISRSSFYRMFESVDDVVKNIEHDIIENVRDICRYYITEKLDLDAADVPDKTILTLFRFFHQNREVYIALNSVRGDPQFRYKHEKLVREFFGGRLAYHNINVEEPDIYMTFVLAGHSEIIDYWLTKRPDISPERMTVLVQKLVYGAYKS